MTENSLKNSKWWANEPFVRFTLQNFAELYSLVHARLVSRQPSKQAGHHAVPASSLFPQYCSTTGLSLVQWTVYKIQGWPWTCHYLSLSSSFLPWHCRCTFTFSYFSKYLQNNWLTFYTSNKFEENKTFTARIWNQTLRTFIHVHCIFQACVDTLL